MADIDEISRFIGSVEATLKQQSGTQLIIMSGIKDINDKLAVIENKTDTAHGRIDLIQGAVNSAEECAVNVKRAKWVLAGLSLASVTGGITMGGLIDKLLKLFGGGN